MFAKTCLELYNGRAHPKMKAHIFLLPVLLFVLTDCFDIMSQIFSRCLSSLNIRFHFPLSAKKYTWKPQQQHRFSKIVTRVQQGNLATWFLSDAHFLICRCHVINSSAWVTATPAQATSTTLFSHLSYWLTCLQACNYAPESSNACCYYFCHFASIVDGDSGVWAAWIALVATLL